MTVERIIALAAQQIGCSREAVWASAQAESLLGAIPLQRFEPHLFKRATGQGVAMRNTFAGNASALAKAMQIDREAAYRSTSVGLFHILGLHHQRIGYASAEEMFVALSSVENVNAQADAFVIYVEGIDPRVGSGLRSLDPVKVGYYNGGSRSPRAYQIKWRAALARAGASPETQIAGPGVTEKLIGWAQEKPRRALAAGGTAAAIAGNLGLHSLSDLFAAVGRGDWGAAGTQASDLIAEYGSTIFGVVALSVAALFIFKAWKGYRHARHATDSLRTLRGAAPVGGAVGRDHAALGRDDRPDDRERSAGNRRPGGNAGHGGKSFAALNWS